MILLAYIIFNGDQRPLKSITVFFTNKKNNNDNDKNNEQLFS